MSDELFEIAFSGQIIEGADLQLVKQQIGAIFKAEGDRLEQLFSGRRIIVKRQADEATTIKYRAAFQKAGAICEINPINKPSKAEQVNPDPVAGAEQPYASRYPESDLVPQALLTEPLGVSAEAIPDLQADIAPVGSPMQQHIEQIPEPVFDIDEFELAPVGSILSTARVADPPPIPDTSGLTIAERGQ